MTLGGCARSVLRMRHGLLLLALIIGASLSGDAQAEKDHDSCLTPVAEVQEQSATVWQRPHSQGSRTGTVAVMSSRISSVPLLASPPRSIR